MLPNPTRTIWRTALFPATLLAVLLGDVSSAAQDRGGPEAYGRLVDFASLTVDGRPFRLRDHRGKIVLLDFWASWCGPCKRQAPKLARLRQKHRDEGFEIVGISTDRERSAMRRFLAAHPELEWPQIFDLDNTSYAVAPRFAVQALPRYVLISRDGTVLRSQVDPRQLGAVVKKALRGELEPEPRGD